MESRLSSHRRETRSRLFHQRLGSVNPLTSILEVEVPREDDLSAPAAFETLGALMHERHHWLQCVGTSMGVSLSLLIELRAMITVSYVDLAGLREDDLPLMRHARYIPAGTTLRHGDIGSALALWERLECLRRLLGGARIADLEVLFDARIFPAHRTASDLTARLIGDALGDEARANRIEHDWSGLAEVDTPRSEEDRRLLNLMASGWSVGARHFMECGARINELLLRAVRAPGTGIEVGPLFTGVYGVVRKLFYDRMGEPAIGKEIALAYLCDVALNGPNPPALPFLAYQRTRPADIFVNALIALEGFDFTSEVDLAEPLDVRAYIASLREHLAANSEYLSHVIPVGDRIGHYIEHLDQGAASARIFQLGEDGLPTGENALGRVAYHLSVVADAMRIRAESPEFFALPVSHYLKDRKEFHGVFDTIQPPVVRYGDSGLHATRDVEGWLTYYLMNAIVQELCLAIVVETPDEIVSTLARYVEPFPAKSRETAIDLAGMAVRGFFHGSELGDRLAAKFRDRVAGR